MAKTNKTKKSVKSAKSKNVVPKTAWEIEAEIQRRFEIRLKKAQTRAITVLTAHIQVNSHIFVDYGNWYCGITKHKDAMIRIKQHMKQKKTPALYPKVCNAVTMENANLVETYFSNLGTTNSANKAGAKPESVYVYVFKRYPNFAELVALLLN